MAPCFLTHVAELEQSVTVLLGIDGECMQREQILPNMNRPFALQQ
eukprot:CAMPEP_0182840706 /NCGR_PEP_ID=MMETSP0006_2-20121128/24612_1 /TAXON_ID=97485 /ORGANISM="Prymnesium parvum, Strain Texoma1" /LENGTH=44 /DNA_ID= /DNA_START= /DNA_END= /DNA_ORIENTATION=